MREVTSRRKMPLRKANVPNKSKIALREMQRCCKVIKMFDILKHTKKLSKCSAEDKPNLIIQLEKLKSVNHQVIAAALLQSADESTATIGDIEINTFEHYKTHPKVAECVKAINNQTMERSVKSSEPPSASSSSPDPPLRKRLLNAQTSHVGKIAKRKAVFMDSLDGMVENNEEQEIAERIAASKLQKSLRNQQNRIANRAKREEKEREERKLMNVYMPEEMRSVEKTAGVEAFQQQQQPQPSLSDRNEFKRSRRDEPGSRERRPPTSSYSNDDRATPPFNGRYHSPHKSQNKNSNDRQQKQHLKQKSNENRSERRQRTNNQAPPSAVDKNKSSLIAMAQHGKEWRETGVHPSWAAKKVATGILPAQGKKITFDDAE